MLNTDLSRGFTVTHVAEKHGWTEPLVWSLALEENNDLQRFEALNWGLRTWDLWDWNDCDRCFGDDWPGRIPAQMVAHILYYFSKEEDLIRDPMAGGGVTPDVCLAFNRRCWAFINADWRNFQHRPAAEETDEGSILIDDYLEILQRTGWRCTHIIQAPLSTQRFSAGMVSAMQKQRILGVTSRYVIILKRQWRMMSMMLQRELSRRV